MVSCEFTIASAGTAPPELSFQVLLVSPTCHSRALARDRLKEYPHNQGVLHMTLLGLLLLGNAVLHGVIVGRFGIKGNAPPAVFGLLYAGLALAAFLGWASSRNFVTT
jgi:hypothetical protein